MNQLKETINLRFIILFAIIVLLGAWRVLHDGGQLTDLSGFTSIGALALFGAAYFKQRWQAYLLPLFILFLSDVLMMQIYYAEFSSGLLYSGWYWTYLAFALMVVISEFILKKVNVGTFLLGALSAGLLHWLITDISPWLYGINITTGEPFSKDLSGYIACLILAIPFSLKFLAGTLIYGVVLFGGFELAKRQFPVLSKPQVA